MKPEPVGEVIHYIIRALNVVVEMAADPATYDEVAAEEESLWAIKSRAELLLSYIKQKQDEPVNFRVVQ
jgi:hypothetical protein